MDNENFKKKDLRVKKTNRALLDALLTLLRDKNFNDITINELCSVAFISRATFYAHFRDKYDLLEYWLDGLKKHIIKDINNYNKLEALINGTIASNKKIIAHIMKGVNSETLTLVQNFIASVIEPAIKRKLRNQNNAHHTILFNFFVGGLLQLIFWQVKNNFPPDFNMMNSYLYDMRDCLMEWDAEQEQSTVSQ